MGGLIAARYAQAHPDELAALVLSGPVIGRNPEIEALLEMDPMPEVPIDPAVLSRDPAVGEAYLADPLVYNGPFKAQTLRALFAAVEALATRPASARFRSSGSMERRMRSLRMQPRRRRSITSAARPPSRRSIPGLATRSSTRRTATMCLRT